MRALASLASLTSRAAVGRFGDRATEFRGPLDVFRWRVLDRLAGRRRLQRDRSSYRPVVRADGAARLHEPAPSLLWIGHSSFVFRLGGVVVATDPNWAAHVARVVRRVVPPGAELSALPPIDVVTVSHNHLDHLDAPTIARIGPAPLYIVPLGNARYLRRAGARHVVELDWWQTHRVGGAGGGGGGIVDITLVPARHWSIRRPWDRNDALWGGFVYRNVDEGAVYHAGDTAYFDGFREIGERAGPIDWALLPIGSYEPRWFMESQHLDPDEAGRAFVELGARHMVAMHWGTFDLTDEPLAEPPAKLRAFFRRHALDESRLWVLDIGESRALRRASSPSS